VPTSVRPLEWKGENFGLPCANCKESYAMHVTPDEDMGLVLCPCWAREDDPTWCVIHDNKWPANHDWCRALDIPRIL